MERVAVKVVSDRAEVSWQHEHKLIQIGRKYLTAKYGLLMKQTANMRITKALMSGPRGDEPFSQPLTLRLIWLDDK